MTDTGVVVSAQTVVSIILALLYAPVGFIVFWRVMPRLCQPAVRLAALMLIAQLLVTFLSLAIQPASVYDRWLWTFSSWEWNESEWNIPATLASVQLALIGGVAFMSAFFNWRHSKLDRLYFVAVGVIFVYLSIDEYFALHENLPDWGSYYALLGISIAAATMLVAAHSPQTARLWHILLLVGLATSATGAMVFDVVPIGCGNVAGLPIEGCLYSSYIEEGLELVGVWLALVAILGLLCHSAPGLPRRAQYALYALPALWLFLLLLQSLAPRLEVALTAERTEVLFESGVRLRGIHVDTDSSNSVRLRIYASARQADYLGLGYSLHLVDQTTGESVAGQNEWANRQHGVWLFGPNYAPVFGQRMVVRAGPSTLTNRAYWIVLSLWRKRDAEFVRLQATSSDLPLLDDTQLILGESVLPAPSAPPMSPPLASFDKGFALGAVDMPDRAKAGDSLAIKFAWRAYAASEVDAIQFLHLGHEETGEWFVYDQPPLGARFPTRLWYIGLSDSETWQVPLPDDLALGRYAAFTGLYRADDQERLPVRDAAGTPWPDNRVALGTIVID